MVDCLKNCPLIERVSDIEKKHDEMNKFIYHLDKKQDENANFLTKLTIDIEQHRIDSRKRDEITHKKIEEGNQELKSHMDEETEDRKRLISEIKMLSKKINANDVSDAVVKTKSDIMWGIIKHIGTVIGTTLILFMLYKVGLKP